MSEMLIFRSLYSLFHHGLSGYGFGPTTTLASGGQVAPVTAPS